MATMGSPRLLLALVFALLAAAIIAAIRSPDPSSPSAPSPEPTGIDDATPVTGGTPEPLEADVIEAASTPTAVPTPFSTGDFLFAGAAPAGFGSEPFRRYVVGAEVGSGVDVDELARFVDTTLADPRSWVGDTVTGFQRVAHPDDGAQFVLVVATPATVDELCAPLETRGIYSCGHNGWIALNLDRWMGATADWPASLETYRRYLVNHEVGHYIVGPDHAECPAAGAPAPIMMQQSIDLAGCRPNGWVYPLPAG